MAYSIKQLPSHENMRTEFNYNPENGLLTRLHGKHAGSIAGRKAPNGYLYVRINRKLTLCHRIIWEIMKGHIPVGMVVDHINGNIIDNRISNLRLATKAQNGFNARQQNKSSYKGIWFDKSRNKYEAYITANKVRHKLGRFSNKDDAIDAVKKARASLHGEFARHGHA